jgi:hypothetical protein
MNLTKVILLAGLLAVGIAAPAAAEVVDFGNGTKWDTTRLEQAKLALGATQAPPAVPCEVNSQHHASQ